MTSEFSKSIDNIRKYFSKKEIDKVEKKPEKPGWFPGW